MNEVDKNKFFDIPGFEGFYQINLNEQVRSLDRHMNNTWSPTGKAPLKGRGMKVFKDSHGYKCVQLSKNGKWGAKKIHVILATIFLPNPNNYPVVRHLNDIKDDNRLSNLCWGTYAENSRDAYRNGIKVNLKGKDHPMYGRKGVNNPTFGKKRPNFKPAASKIVLDMQMGIFYESAAQAAKAKNYHEGVLRQKLQGRKKNNTGLVYA